MVKKITDIIKKNPLLSGSFTVLAGTALANLGSYLFHLAMGRLLGPTDYGILASLISLSYYLGVPVSVLTLVVVKFVSQKNREKEKVSFFIKKISKKITPWGLFTLMIFLLSFPLLKKLVKVDSFFLFLGLGLSSYLAIYLSIISSTLLGIMKFLEFSLFNILGSWLKLLVSVTAVLLGLRVGGAVYATVISTLLSLMIGWGFVKRYIPVDLRGNINIRNSFTGLKSYSLAILFSNLSLTSLFTFDIILARYFLSPVLAGQYAALSVLGKIIYFASSPLVSVMFPMASERHANGGNYHELLGESFLLVLSISVLVSLIYFIFPEQMILILFGQKYISAASNLGFFAVFISFYSLCSLLMNFYLSVSKTKIVYFGIIFVFLQIIFIYFYHQNIHQIISVNIITLFLFLICLVVYYLRTFPLSLEMKMN